MIDSFAYKEAFKNLAKSAKTPGWRGAISRWTEKTLRFSLTRIEEDPTKAGDETDYLLELIILLGLELTRTNCQLEDLQGRLKQLEKKND